MKSSIEVLSENLSKKELENVSKALAQSYKALMSDSQVWDMIFSVVPNSLLSELLPHRETELGHEFLNSLLLSFYPGELLVKYRFVKDNLSNQDEVLAFEVNIGSSRLDLARINGCSYAYEVKTILDKADRLPAQISNYGKAFEYLCIIIHEKHLDAALDIVPEYCGILAYDDLSDLSDDCSFRQFRKADLNPYLDSQFQVRSLSSKDLSGVLNKNGIFDVPIHREERERLLFQALSEKEINDSFKWALKSKYRRQWSFVKANFDSFLPIDMELFYRTPLDPKWVYYKDSSMV